MARPLKLGLSYFPFDVDFFGDKKIRRLRAKYGTDGVTMYIYLLCEIYHNGYYIELDDDLILDISDDLNISEDETRQIVRYLVSRSLLNEILANSVTILTATSIQRRFQEAKKGSKREVVVDASFWLLQKNETESFIKVYPDDSKSENNPSKSENNPSKSENYSQSKVKESKVNKSKENKSKVLCSSDAENQHIDGKVKLTQEQYNELINDYGESVVEECIGSINVYINNNNVKPYNNHYETIIKWINEGKANGKNSGIVHTNKPNNEDSKYSQNF